jgi:hypothetical protein
MRESAQRHLHQLAPVLLERPGQDRDPGLIEALGARRTIREIAASPLTLTELSTLLWAANGVNRARGPFGYEGRTAGSASNSQEIEIHVALEDGAFLYDPVTARLEPVSAADVRSLARTPGQDVAFHAPVQLIFVANMDRLDHTRGFDEPGLHDPDVQKAYAYVDMGLIAQNVQLMAAGLGLAAWLHNCDRKGLSRALGLRPEQKVLFAQSVGRPET